MMMESENKEGEKRSNIRSLVVMTASKRILKRQMVQELMKVKTEIFTALSLASKVLSKNDCGLSALQSTKNEEVPNGMKSQKELFSRKK